MSSGARVYVPVTELIPAPTVPDGFTLTLVTDGKSYTFSLKDTLDPCRFAYFSDQDGIIYDAIPSP